MIEWIMIGDIQMSLSKFNWNMDILIVADWIAMFQYEVHSLGNIFFLGKTHYSISLTKQRSVVHEHQT